MKSQMKLKQFAFDERSESMKAPVGLLSDRTVLRSKMEGPRPTNSHLSRNQLVQIFTQIGLSFLHSQRLAGLEMTVWGEL